MGHYKQTLVLYNQVSVVDGVLYIMRGDQVALWNWS